MNLDKFLDVAYALVHEGKTSKNNNLLISYYIKASANDQLTEDFEEVIYITEEELEVFRTVTIEEILRLICSNKTDRYFRS